MKAVKVLAIVMLAMFAYSAVNAQPHHRPRFRHHHVVRHPMRHRRENEKDPALISRVFLILWKFFYFTYIISLEGLQHERG
jgi:hypothetical protein